MSGMSLNDLQDVTITSPSIDNKIAYDGSLWVNYYAKILLSYDDYFKSKTITVTQGQTSKTVTLPSLSNEYMIFVWGKGNYTISITESGQTFSDTVEVTGQNEIYTATLTYHGRFRLYSAVGDTVIYTDADGVQKTAVFDANSPSKYIDLSIDPDNGTSITFTSSIAKDVSQNGQTITDYSKTILVTQETTDIFIMPDYTLYWWGYMSDDLEFLSNANGWSITSSSYTGFNDPTVNTNYLDLNSEVAKYCGVGSKTQKSSLFWVRAVATGVTEPYSGANNYGTVVMTTTKSFDTYYKK